MLSVGINEQIQSLEKALKTLNIEQTAVEFHGFVCGHVVLGDHDSAGWLSELIGEQPTAHIKSLNDDELSPKEATLLLAKKVSEAIEAINSEDLNFELLIPDENYPIQHRLEALISWCDGFLYAFGLSIASSIKAGFEFKENSPIGEVIKDIGRFAKIDCESEQEGAETDLALMDITEYIKTGLFLIYTEIRGASVDLDKASLN